MCKKRTTIVGLALAMCLMAAGLTRAAQQSAHKQQDNDPTEVVSLESTLVKVPAAVSDRSGRTIPGLRRDDFLLTEDGVEQTIADLSRAEEPISVAILIDTSSSAGDHLSQMKEAAFSFVRQLRPQDRAMLVSFNDQVYIDSEFTSDREALSRAVWTVQPGGGTQLYEAVYLTTEQRLKSIDGRKAILLLSDGLDTASPDSQEKLLRFIEESDLSVYAIHFNPRRRPRQSTSMESCRSPFPIRLPRNPPIADLPRAGRIPDDEAQEPTLPRKQGIAFLDQLTEMTGGRFYRAKEVRSLRDTSAVMAHIAEDLRHQYVLSYHPTNDRRDGTYRQIRLRIRTGAPLVVRARRGYTAPSGDASEVARSDNRRGQ